MPPALPTDAAGQLGIEVGGADDQVALPETGLDISWLPWRDPAAWGVAPQQAVAPPSSKAPRVWVACEAAVVRRIRRRLLERGPAAPRPRGLT
jgi:NADPH-dependent ferric siderophore reductase